MSGPTTPVGLATVAREWARIGALGFGGPPAHLAMFRQRFVVERGWIGEDDFQHGIAATNVLPGPGSTQMAIYCAWRVAGTAGAIVGGLAFIVPGLVLIIALAALFLGHPPAWVRGLGAGASAVVPAVAVDAAAGMLPASWRAAGDRSRARWGAYVVVGAVATVALGPWLVLVLLTCGGAELLIRRAAPLALPSIGPLPLLAAAGASAGGVGALVWTALKVGALSYGGGFVIIPLMQADAVTHHHWMTAAQFDNAVALGQATPGPVVHTVAVVGYAARGVAGALLAAAVAFAPSFSFVLLGARRFDRLRESTPAQAFLGGAGPAALGAILGAAVPLARSLTETWQFVVLAAGLVALLALRRGTVPTLLGAAAIGAALAVAGAPLPT